MTRFTLCLLFVCLLSALAVSQTGSRNAPSIRNDKPAGRTQPAIVDPMNAPPPPPASKPTPNPEDEVVRVETNLVTTPVSVLDRQGRFIPGLKKRDFKIFENDIPQPITYFESSEKPFTVILMIDTSPSTRYHIDEIHYAAVTFVNQLRPADKVMVMAFDQRLRILTEPTSEKQKIYAAIYKAQFGSGTSLYDAVDYVTSLDLVNALGRKAVVLFTDGVDTTSRRANLQSSVASVEEVDALFYPIRYNTQNRGNASGGPVAQAYATGVVAQLARGQSSAEYERGRIYLEALATNSGGRMFDTEAVPNLETAFAGVAEELRRQYSIGYYATEGGKPGDRKKIKIQVTRPPKAVVRAKTNYVVKEARSESTSPGTQSSIR
jgi:Ca-activated chloride channel homolog